MKVIPTYFKGIEYRSRIEARWAVFFSELRIKYEYEKEGYDLGKYKYLPDFYLLHLDCFIEIKGKYPTPDEMEKGSLLADATQKKVYIFWGSIPVIEQDMGNSESAIVIYPCSIDYPENKKADPGGHDYEHWFCECDKCGMIGIEYLGRIERLSCGCNKEIHKLYGYYTWNLFKAYNKARNEKFDGVRI